MTYTRRTLMVMMHLYLMQRTCKTRTETSQTRSLTKKFTMSWMESIFDRQSKEKLQGPPFPSTTSSASMRRHSCATLLFLSIIQRRRHHTTVTRRIVTSQVSKARVSQALLPLSRRHCSLGTRLEGAAAAIVRKRLMEAPPATLFTP